MGEAKRRREYSLNMKGYQLRARKQFASQMALDQGPFMLSIGMVRKPALVARLMALAGKGNEMGLAANEKEYLVDCAFRAFTHFNPQHGYFAKSECLRCKREISDSINISIVMMALP